VKDFYQHAQTPSLKTQGWAHQQRKAYPTNAEEHKQGEDPWSWSQMNELWMTWVRELTPDKSIFSTSFPSSSYINRSGLCPRMNKILIAGYESA
jgi:hypothetical protein